MKKVKNDTRDVQQSLNFIVDNMAMAKDVDRLEKKFDEMGARLEKKIDAVGARLEAKIDRVDNKLGAFENHEVDKRLQLTVRVGAVENHLHLKPPVGTTS